MRNVITLRIYDAFENTKNEVDHRVLNSRGLPCHAIKEIILKPFSVKSQQREE